MDTAFLQARIAKIDALIEAYEDASLALAGGAQSYTIDTGQTRTTVTKSNLTEIDRNIDRLMNRRAVLQSRLDGSGRTTVRPIW